MSYRGDGFAGSCYNCGRDRGEVCQQKGLVGCGSCKDKYFSEEREKENSEKPTLRDQFAMAALNVLTILNVQMMGTSLSIANKEIAQFSYAFADTMLEERKK